MKFSFVIPVYNVSPYLRQCVESVLWLEYDDMEVILIDDESTDGSAELCDILTQEDNRVICHHISHCGLSTARNRGLSYVTGDYVIYVDSDDFLRWDKRALERTATLLLENEFPDVLFFGHRIFVSRGRGEIGEQKSFIPILCVPQASEVALEFFLRSAHLPVQAWSKMVKVETLRRNGISFPDGYIGEDCFWFIDMMEAAKNIVCINEFPYVYRINRPGSIMSSCSKRIYEYQIIFIETQIKKIAQDQMTARMKECVLSFTAYILCLGMFGLKHFPREERKSRIEKLKTFEWLLTHRLHPRVKKIGMVCHIIGFRATVELLLFFGRIFDFNKIR